MLRQDATDHFYSLHSEKAIAQLKRMRPMETKEDVPETVALDEGASLGLLVAAMT